MQFDYTSYLSFIQIFIELNITFLVLDRTNFLFRFQHGILNEFRDAHSGIIQEARNALNERRTDMDIEWLRKKGILRAALIKACSRLPEEHPNASVFWNSIAPSLAIVAICFCVYLLYMIAGLRSFESPTFMNCILLTSQGTIAVIIVLFRLYFTESNARTSLLIAIAFIWELLMILCGFIFGIAGLFLHIVPFQLNPYVIGGIVWVPFFHLPYMCSIYIAF